MTADRLRVLARVRAALASLSKPEPMPVYPDDVALSRSAPAEKEGEQGKLRAAAFLAQLANAGGRGFTEPAALARWLAGEGHRRGYCDPLLLADLAVHFPPEVVLESKLDVRRIDDYAFGITRAAGAIAETGTIILDDKTTSRRLAALAPWVHVAVVRAGTIHLSVADAVASLGGDPNVVWCTGPSKTADVEGIIIEGVHGPGEQAALITM